MKKILFALIALSSLAAACHERKDEPRPDYEGVKAASERAHTSQDAESTKLDTEGSK